MDSPPDDAKSFHGKAAEAFFVAKDPEGFLIELRKKTWYGHVLRTDERALRLGRYTRDHLKATIEDADEIRQDHKSNRLNRVYFKEWKGVDKFNKYLKVATYIYDPKEKRGLIVTAVPYRVLPPLDDLRGETKVWPK